MKLTEKHRNEQVKFYQEHGCKLLFCDSNNRIYEWEEEMIHMDFNVIHQLGLLGIRKTVKNYNNEFSNMVQYTIDGIARYSLEEAHNGNWRNIKDGSIKTWQEWCDLIYIAYDEPYGIDIANDLAKNLVQI